MKRDVSIGTGELANASEQAALVSEYRQMRAVGNDLNNRLVTRLAKDALDEGAAKLGLLHNGKLVITEQRMSVLMDYCLFHVYRDGLNAVDQYLFDSPPAEDSDEWSYIQAMQMSIYSLFVVDSVIPEAGVVARNLASDRSHFLIDIGLSSCAEPGIVIVSRLLNFDNYSMTGGAMLPTSWTSEKSAANRLKTIVSELVDQEEGLSDPAHLIRAMLNHPSADQVEYRNPNDPGDTSPAPLTRLSGSKPGRNAPCPCGSGKKYKQCCLRKMKG